MAKGFNGGIIGTRNLTTGGGIGQGTATGIWSLSEAQIARLAGIWPEEVPSGIFNGVQIFSESSTWTVPIGVTSVEYLVVGGGGGGSGYQPAVDWGGGGGAGGYLASPNISVTPTAQYTVVQEQHVKRTLNQINVFTEINIPFIEDNFILWNCGVFVFHLLWNPTTSNEVVK